MLIDFNYLCVDYIKVDLKDPLLTSLNINRFIHDKSEEFKAILINQITLGIKDLKNAK